ncbi:hypothetical protein D0863_11844 [Hortaea werneckii]|uniref:Uncharacterized protein n=1 Tax=Hortaea werneckii TaxID=91943 RepID=A0A3M7D5V7_HORWE|nr:hypothetical protein D0863_11844 [Hortaea werneckii]
MIDGLLEKTKRTKLTDSLKAVVFDQEIGELVGKIERTKSLLILTSNLCLPEQILGQLAPVIDAQQRANPGAVLAMAGQTFRTPSDPSLHPSPSPVAQRSACVSDESKPTALRKTPGRRFRYRVSTWLLQCAWTLTTQRAYSGWTVSLHCHGRLPRDHPAAIACIEGDCSKMQSLLDAGQVSPHDEVQGESLAQLAAFAGHLPMIRLLRAVGADMRINSRDSAEVRMDMAVGKDLADYYTKCSLVNEFWYGWRIDRELSQSLSCLLGALRFFDNHCELDFEDDDFIDPGLFLLYTRSLISFSVHDRLVLFNSMLQGCRELGPCLDIVKPALTDPTYFTMEIEIWHRPYLLHLLAQAFGKDCCIDEATYTGRVDALLQAGVAAVSNLHTLDQLGSGMTPLMHVIFSVSRHCQHLELNFEQQRWELKPLEKRLQELRRAMRRWLMIMQKLGVNLHRYGKLEERAFRKHWKHNQQMLWEFCYSQVEIICIKYGSKPAEWDLCTVNPFDAHLEEFWRMIEDPVPTHPGGWIEDCIPDPDSNVLRLSRKPLGRVLRVRDIRAIA